MLQVIQRSSLSLVMIRSFTLYVSVYFKNVIDDNYSNYLMSY